MMLVGPAGTGKTFQAVAMAVEDIRRVDTPRTKLVVLRPAVEADRSLGHLPGTLSEKLEPFFSPVRQALARIGGCDEVIFQSLGHARGVTWERSVVVVDEAQNASFEQLRLILTRLGRDSKMILAGDLEQTDLKSRNGVGGTGFQDVIARLKGMQRVAVVEFENSEVTFRHPLLPELLRRLRGYST